MSIRTKARNYKTNFLGYVHIGFCLCLCMGTMWLGFFFRSRACVIVRNTNMKFTKFSMLDVSLLLRLTYFTIVFGCTDAPLNTLNSFELLQKYDGIRNGCTLCATPKCENLMQILSMSMMCCFWQ